MRTLKINIQHAEEFIAPGVLAAGKETAAQRLKLLEQRKGKGNEFLGWMDLPVQYNDALYRRIQTDAEDFREKSDYIVLIGIGGSYLGARAIIEALSDHFNPYKQKKPQIVYAGNNISEDYLADLMDLLKDKEFSVVVISKSGTTTEPAIAFRLLREALNKRYDASEAAQRIIAITDKEKGRLKQLADKEGYKTYVIPDDVGGRYSVLSPVGLLPIALAGININELIAGAKEIMKTGAQADNFDANPVLQYAATRNTLYQSNRKIEIMVSYEPSMHYFHEWWKQLFGESEGKDGKGIFPASVVFSTDLHSMGQYIQEGERHLFETIIKINESQQLLSIPTLPGDDDDLGYLAGKRIQEVNHRALQGTLLAHTEGNVPNILVEIPEKSAFYLGQLIFFFEKACALSGYILDVNPFNQPGVETYKKNMFALLKKPGFEEMHKKIIKKIKD